MPIQVSARQPWQMFTLATFTLLTELTSITEWCANFEPLTMWPPILSKTPPPGPLGLKDFVPVSSPNLFIL